jgi:hypothetical protein
LGESLCTRIDSNSNVLCRKRCHLRGPLDVAGGIPLRSHCLHRQDDVPLSQSAFMLPDGCVAYTNDFKSHYLASFASLTSCTLQARTAPLSLWILGSRKKLNNNVWASNYRWHRRFVFANTVFEVASLSCVCAITDFFLMMKGKCWELATKGFVITSNIIDGLFTMIILLSLHFVLHIGRH